MKAFGLSLLALALIAAVSVRAQVPPLINYQGRLIDGTNLYNGTASISCRLYTGVTGGSAEFVSTGTIEVVDGLYSTLIGEYPTWSDLDTALARRAFWLEVEINGVTLSPREPLASVGYCIKPGIKGERNSEYWNTATVGGGWDNNAQNQFSTVGGGQTNLAAGIGATVGGGVNNSAPLGEYATVGGGFNNYAPGVKATIAGGELNTADGNPDGQSTVGGGYHNQSLAWAATVGGGWWNSATGQSSTVSGGNNNSAVSLRSTVAGGSQNMANGDNATVSGGELNTILNGAHSAIGGGRDNQITNSRAAVIGGGETNHLWTGTDSVIAGGRGNVMLRGSVCNISGGKENAVLGTSPWVCTYCVVGGGYSNMIAGGGLSPAPTCSVIPGGADNKIYSDYSLAAGRGAEAEDDNVFVWSDANGPCVSTNDNQFIARASGGFVFYTAAGTANGAELTPGSGDWTALSDRDSKKNFAPVDPREVLERVSVIPITMWSWKPEDPSSRHMGPMAQDFYSAFGLGNNEKRINNTDAHGVSLAAIQGLYQLVKEKDGEIKELKARLTALEKAAGVGSGK